MIFTTNSETFKLKFVKVSKSYIHVYAISTKKEIIKLNSPTPSSAKLPDIEFYNTESKHLDSFGYRIISAFRWDLKKMLKSGNIIAGITDTELLSKLYKLKIGDTL